MESQRHFLESELCRNECAVWYLQNPLTVHQAHEGFQQEEVESFATARA